ncbi:uncharacterized protein LOC103698592 [Phoenix dactylifera]|uniref:E3 ubiquitin-protein ligase RMA n=1 Tax=Phoenix dactylifera TaxID=42345 RepID=A0A8B7BJW2_PHODC|nr:uncharacterized protein LOC103698592 [Phoenix dactylifera]
MADDENRMDLNLYVGLPPLPRPRNPDLGLELPLGLELTLSSLPWSPSPSRESRSLAPMSRRFERPIYSPSNALHAPESLPVDPLHAADDSPPLEPCIPARLVELETHAPNSAPYAPASAGPDRPSARHPPAGRIPQLHDEAATSVNPCSTVRMSELMSRGDRAGSRHEHLECQELRFQRLIESNNRLRPRRSGMSDGERSDSQTSPDQLMHDIMQSQRTLEASKKDKPHAEGKGTEGLEKGKEDEGAASFECNICFDMAKEPVVTPCGHLFCWPCLYQWLHVNPVFPECPVCKGEVRESNLTPIYGRGGSDTTAKEVSGEDRNSGLKIPPRPRAHRTESLRQELQRSSGGILALGESATAWRHIDEEARAAVSFGEDPGPSLQLRFNASDRAFISRLMQWRMQREEGSGSNITGIDLPAITEPNPQTDGIDVSRQPPQGHASTSRWRARRRFAVRGAIPAVNHRRPTAEQASASSTPAVIPGDIAATDISAEPNRAGSSRSLRRRGRSSNSGSLDADGEASHSHRRRRLN